MTRAQKGTVYLVGAGPGDPELLTLRAASLLQTADVIYHDDLVSQEVLQLARATALVISVGKRCGAKRVTQLEINNKLVDSAQRGLTVVRLKSGDPLIFGRAGEELKALTAAGIPCEIVPGISAVTAAAAAIQCSLTSRDAASSVFITTGHHAKTQNTALAPTRVVYMPGSDLAEHAEKWLREGDSPEMPCALVSRVSQPDQSIYRTTLSKLATAPAPATPAVLLAGWALEQVDASGVFEAPPLPGGIKLSSPPSSYE
jgi:uroporphyrin-III C-methyltransferase / precorrin-2 dehydrogenase / sirohydrochlorin ferrochelatase